MSDLLVREVRPVPLDGERPASGDGLVDVLVRDGLLAAVGPRLVPDRPVPELAGEGRWAVPGLWDQHVHFTQWGLTTSRLDLSGTGGPEDVLALVRARLREGGPGTPTGVLSGWGYRSATWARQPSVAALDAVSGAVPVVLVSGDGHNGWLNSAGLRMLGERPREGAVEEDEWFALYTRLGELAGADQETEAGVVRAVRAAHAKGVVGVVDLEWARSWRQWTQRYASGVGPLRVRTGVYPDRLEEVVAGGWRSGDPVPGTHGLVTMGPLKVISDGSLNTRTAWCCEPYADGDRLADAAGRPNVAPEQLRDLVSHAHRHGIRAALHAIGDRAVLAAIEAFAATGASGSIEHAQLVRAEDLARWAGLPVRASVQPAHLLDDRVVTEQCWPDRTDRTFTLRSMLDHGIELALGSDAPVAPLDPWLAMATAVHRGPVHGPAWHPEQSLSPVEALRASVDGRRLAVGEPGDVALLDADPLAPGSPEEQASRLRDMRVGATVVAGRLAWSDPG